MGLTMYKSKLPDLIFSGRFNNPKKKSGHIDGINNGECTNKDNHLIEFPSVN